MSTALSSASFLLEPEVQASRLGDLLADREHRVERGLGSWKIIAMSRPRILRISDSLLSEQVSRP